MANVYDGVVDTDNQYEELESELSVTLVADTTYTLQVQSGNFIISKDSQGGIIVPIDSIFNFTPKDGDTYYIRTVTPCSICIL